MKKRTLFAVLFPIFLGFSMLFFACVPFGDDASGGGSDPSGGTGPVGGDPGNPGGGTPEDISVASVSLNETVLNLMPSETETLTASVQPNNATNAQIDWSSSNAGVATVDNTGKVTAGFPGTATITVTTKDGGKTAQCTVNVLQTVHESVIEYYWVDEHDDLVTTSNGTTSITRGTTLAITAQGSGYTVRQWYVDGLTVDGDETYIFSSMTVGDHVIDLLLEKGGKPYSTTITITVGY